MKNFIQGIFDGVRPKFHEGGDLKRWFPFFEFGDTFMLSMDTKTTKGAHVRDPADLKRLMMFVIFALVPATVYGMYNVGFQAFAAEGLLDQVGILDMFLRGAWHMMPIIIVSYAVGGLAEMVFCVIREHEVNEGFLVTGLLFPLVLPPTIPLWMVAVGIVFGVVIGKEVFGGTGMNILNPALTARAFVFFSYPAAISGAKVWDVAGIANPLTTSSETLVDGYTGATPLLAVSSVKPGKLPDWAAGLDPSERAVAALNQEGWDFMALAMGNLPGSMGEVSAVAALVGAIFLVVTGIASWRIMVGCVAGVLATGAMFNALATGDSVTMMHLPAHYHLVVGGFAFGAAFMATDPVSGAITPTGRWIYGFFIGVMCALIRVVNPAYPEGMMLAILFMNVFAPLLDYYAIKGMRTRRLARLNMTGEGV